MTQEKLLRFCRQEEIAVTGFSPLGSLSYSPIEDSVLETDAVRSAAARHDKAPAQVVLRWGIQRGTALVPKSSRRDRLIENQDLFSFSLNSDEMAAISSLDRHRRFNDPGEFCEVDFDAFFPIYE